MPLMFALEAVDPTYTGPNFEPVVVAYYEVPAKCNLYNDVLRELLPPDKQKLVTYCDAMVIPSEELKANWVEFEDWKKSIGKVGK
jgi:hypothetical protein